MKSILFLLIILVSNICQANDTIPYSNSPYRKPPCYSTLDKSVLECSSCNDLKLVGDNQGIKYIEIYSKVCRLHNNLFLQRDLKEFNMHFSKLKSSDNKRGINQLEILNLYDGKLKKVPTFVWDNKKLLRLSLYLEHFESLEDSLATLSNLTNLDLHTDKSIYFPKSILQLKNLEILHLEIFNKKVAFKEFPVEIAQLENLEELQISIPFDLIAEHLFSLKKIKRLHVKSISNLENTISVLKRHPNIVKFYAEGLTEKERLTIHKELPYIRIDPYYAG